jgi:hypothetical protein
LATESESDSEAGGPGPTRVESESDSLAKGADGPPPTGLTRPGDLTTPAIDADAERRALVDLIIYAYDRTTSSGVRARLAEGLAVVGVDVVHPEGEAFDPSRFEAGGTEPTDDPERHGTVAETEIAGFTDRGSVIRDPVVVVYRHP